MNLFKNVRFWISFCLILAAASFSQVSSPQTGGNSALPPEVRPIETSELHNVFKLTTNVYSGSAPETDVGFAELARLGIKTIITVDGARPDLEAARRHGMRYVHLPHGYDGISTNLQHQFAKAALTLSGPIYVHCHHGKHRGPTAAAVICMAANGWTPEQGEAWLKAAGTASHYAGLYEVVRDYKAPSERELEQVPAEFPEIAEVSGLVEAMVNIDERWEHLRAVRAAGYRSPPNHPDLEPANESVILWEAYREAQRLPEAAKRGADFLARLKWAEEKVKEAERLLRSAPGGATPEIRERLDAAFDAIGRSCSACHREYRD